MRDIGKALIVGAALLALYGCAAPAPRADRGVDAGKVVAVDRWAERKHATVMWVHYPQAAGRAD